MKQALNFGWQFLPDYKEEYLNNLPNSSQTINIPHCAKEVPYNYFNEKDYQFKSIYQKRKSIFFVPHRQNRNHPIGWFLFCN